MNQCPRQNACQPNPTLLTSTINNDDWRWLVSDGSMAVLYLHSLATGLLQNFGFWGSWSYVLPLKAQSDAVLANLGVCKMLAEDEDVRTSSMRERFWKGDPLQNLSLIELVLFKLVEPYCTQQIHDSCGLRFAPCCRWRVRKNERSPSSLKRDFSRFLWAKDFFFGSACLTIGACELAPLASFTRGESADAQGVFRALSALSICFNSQVSKTDSGREGLRAGCYGYWY